MTHVNKAPDQVTIKTIIDNDLCIGCGACVKACRNNNLRMVFNETKGMYEPEYIDPNKQGDDHCGCVNVCPSYQMNYNELSEYRFGVDPTSEIGVHEAVYLGQSIDLERNLKASSGGMIKETLRYLFDTKQIDAVIALNKIEGITHRPVKLYSADAVDQLPGSVYHNVNFEDTLTLLQESNDRVALVAIPCQLEGIFSYIRTHEPSLADKIILTIGLICGWTYSHHSLRAISDYFGIKYEDLDEVSYRGGGAVGKLKLQKKNGEVKEISRRTNLRYQAAFDRSFNLKRCHYCVNHQNFLADLVVGDAWLPSTVFTKTGISLVIARTPYVKGLMESLEKAEKIKLLEVSEDEVIESQKPRIVYGNFAYAYADFIKRRQEFSPTLTGPNQAKTKPVSDDQLASFDQLFKSKVAAQRKGQYRRLLLLKYTREINTFIHRYVEWFLVRIVRIKSLKGERQELASEDMKRFR